MSPMSSLQQEDVKLAYKSLLLGVSTLSDGVLITEYNMDALKVKYFLYSTDFIIEYYIRILSK